MKLSRLCVIADSPSTHNLPYLTPRNVVVHSVFEIAPLAKKLFSFAVDFEGTSSDKNEDLEQLLKSRHLINHASGVITMLNQCIDMIGNFDLSPLIHVLHELGGRHYEYGVQPEHYPIVCKALLLTLETVLGNEDQWNNTPGMKQSWTSIFGIISSAMLDGSNQRREMEQKL